VIHHDSENSNNEDECWLQRILHIFVTESRETYLVIYHPFSLSHAIKMWPRHLLEERLPSAPIKEAMHMLAGLFT